MTKIVLLGLLVCVGGGIAGLSFLGIPAPTNDVRQLQQHLVLRPLR